MADPDGVNAATFVAQPEHGGKRGMGEFLNAAEQLTWEHLGIVTLVGVAKHSYSVASRLMGLRSEPPKAVSVVLGVQLTKTLDPPHENQEIRLSNRSVKGVKQTTDRRDKGSTTIALVRAGNQKNRPFPCAVRSD
jgi:hypothetical protein